MNFDIDKRQSLWHIDGRQYTRGVPPGTREGPITMIHMHPGTWLTSREDPGADRDRAHRVALFEAKFATDYHASTVAITRTPAPVRRMALVSTGSSADLVACCA